MIPGLVAQQSAAPSIPGLAPVITSSASATVNEGAALAKTLTADQVVTWSIVGGVDAAKFEISGSTLRWLSDGVKDYESPDDADANNAYVVTVRATGTGGTDDQTITVTVADVASPTITSTNTGTVDEGVPLAKPLTANATVTWSIVGGADAAQFEISGATLRWLGNGVKDYESPDDVGAGNDYVVDVRATTAAGEVADQTITVTVANVAAPTITSSNTATVDEGAALAKGLTANQAVTWSVVGGADQAKFEISGATLRWLSNGVKDYEAPDDADADNAYIVTVRAIGVDGTADQTITVTVANVVSPTITSTNTATVNEGATLAKSLTADQVVSWSLVGGADQSKFELSGATLRWLGNGVKDFEAPNDANADNAYIVQVRATNSTTGETTDQTITVTVADITEGATSTRQAALTGTLATFDLNETARDSSLVGADIRGT